MGMKKKCNELRLGKRGGVARWGEKGAASKSIGLGAFSTQG